MLKFQTQNRSLISPNQHEQCALNFLIQNPSGLTFWLNTYMSGLIWRLETCLGLHYGNSLCCIPLQSRWIASALWTNFQISIHHQHHLTFFCLCRNHTWKSYFRLIPKMSRALLDWHSWKWPDRLSCGPAFALQPTFHRCDANLFHNSSTSLLFRILSKVRSCPHAPSSLALLQPLVCLADLSHQPPADIRGFWHNQRWRPYEFSLCCSHYAS